MFRLVRLSTLALVALAGCTSAVIGGNGEGGGDGGTVECAAAGGKCVAKVAGYCSDGTIGAADQYTCDSADLGCCFPDPSTRTCTGAGGYCGLVVPDFCTDGRLVELDSTLAGDYACGEPGYPTDEGCCLPAN